MEIHRGFPYQSEGGVPVVDKLDILLFFPSRYED